MARVFLVAQFLCVVCVKANSLGFSLVQKKAEAVTAHGFQHAGDDDPPSESDVTNTLENVNSTLDKVAELIETVNSTASSAAADFLGAITDFQTGLTALSDAAEAADNDTVMDQVQSIIGNANSSCIDVSSKVSASLATVSTQLGDIMPSLYAAADDVTSQYLDALTTINTIYNVTSGTVTLAKNRKGEKKKKALKKKSASEEDNDSEDEAQAQEDAESMSHAKAHAQENTAKKSKAHDKANAKGNAKSKGKKTHKKEAMALLQERAFQTQGSMSKSRVEASVARKGGAGDLCSDASAQVSKANSTLNSLSDMILAVNATVVAISMIPVGEIMDGVDVINGTVAPLLANLPEDLATPVSSSLDTITAFKESAMGDASKQISEYETMIADAAAVLAAVTALTDQLQASIDQQPSCQAISAVPNASSVPAPPSR
jgi:hypothetical protein